MNNKEVIIEVEGEVKEESFHFNVIPFYTKSPWYKDRCLLFLFSIVMFILLATCVTILVVYLIE